MTDDLVEQMKGRAKFCRNRGEIKTPGLLEQGFARIEALTAERDRLREALEGLMAHEPDYSDTLWQDARTALKGETNE